MTAQVIEFGKGTSSVYTPTLGIAAAGGFAATATLVHTGGIPATAGTVGTDSTPVTTEVDVAEVFIPCNMTVTGIAFLKGSVVTNDEVIVSLYDSAGAVVANSALAGTTTAATVDIYQRVAFTAPYAAVGPATYYVGLSFNGTTDRYNTHVFGNFRAGTITGETFGTLATITPPTTFTASQGPIASLY